MQYDEFVGEVQHRARLPSRGKAERAIEATLATLAERLGGGEGHHMLAQLPGEFQSRIVTSHDTDRFDFDEFKARVAKREGVEEGDATFHARAVIEVWREAVSPQQAEHVIQQLPDDFRPLFEAGSQGELRA